MSSFAYLAFRSKCSLFYDASRQTFSVKHNSTEAEASI
ncbi:hypothetical protein GPLA_4154 [Paraglaciecola polaris LMG 21857]|uniref:Uncharacterized protein n=1 Tax=Paraglaciecola polaris LMG 21857 TaxID=1129793 RepID=K7A265_9ALTE|nr:hypothetical protein GPLA_4154 [Paraglaciecola polaris LMG 21857]